MKIGSGIFRGRTIESPKGKSTRPTSGRLKKALFDILAPRLPGARVLDLFAGGGALGLEALSRGASRVTFVERGRSAVQVIESNLDKLGAADQAEILQYEARSALKLLGERTERFQLILLDPPYRVDIHDSVLGQIDRLSLLDIQGMVIVEHHHKRALADDYGSLKKVRQVRAGESCLTFFRQGSR
jgi:16S rRNA (guanine(966)-N(2))-methyltransferase RsmD